MPGRRFRTSGTLFVVVLLVVAGVTPALALGATDSGESASWTTAPVSEAGTAPQQDRPVIRQRAIASRNDEPGSVSLTFEYRIPPSVTGLRVGIPVTSISGVSVESTNGFESDTTGFLWDGETEQPSITLRFAVTDSLAGGIRGVERDDWALVSEPNTRIQARTSEQPVQTTSFEVAADEQGYASSHLAYLGPHERRNATVADENATFVLGAEEANPDRAIDFLRTANENFDFGVQRDGVTVFVLPIRESEMEGIEAASVDTAFWVSEMGLQLDETGAVFAHEYVHTRLGTVGAQDATWLNEASAEYYGRLFALNDGIGSYDSFQQGLAAPEYAGDREPVILANPETWQGTTAHYDKGAHVLAALDAEIRKRTGGERTLRDVFEGRSAPFEEYTAFRTAVVELTGDESLGRWLDRYVLGDALPPLPDNPRYYVAEPSLDPDGDGMSSGAELDEGRHPFVPGEGGGVEPMPERTDTGTATATEDATTATATATATPTGGTEGDGSGFGVVVAVVATLLVAVRLRRT